MNDTICAISTALGTGAISIIRVSGEDAIKIVNKIFIGKNLESVPTHTINYGKIHDKKINIDEVLISVMRAPKTFTTEDVVEINCHGGIAPTNKILELLILNGCRLAEPGEFTKRAFLNGRIDLVEAEGISDMIIAKTEEARKLAISQIDGNLSKMIKIVRQEIVEIMANIEVNIDYPEYEDAEDITQSKLKLKLESVIGNLNKILQTAADGKILKEGINIALIGRPNVGKSSILNALLEEEKAIVTDIAGTTRDIVEGQITLNGIVLNIIDTAGIRETTDIIEKIGVNKSKKIIENVDLIIIVLNNNEKLSEEDDELLKKIKSKKHLVFINKDDLDSKLNHQSLENLNYIFGNTIRKDGLTELKNEITKMFNLEKIQTKDYTYLTNARQIALVKQAINYFEQANNDCDESIPVDMIAIDIKNGWDTLGEIIGETYKDELLDELFSNFCLGK